MRTNSPIRITRYSPNFGQPPFQSRSLSMSGHGGCYSPDLRGLFPCLKSQDNNFDKVSNLFKTVINRQIPILVDVFCQCFRLLRSRAAQSINTSGVSQGHGNKLQERGIQSQAKHGRIGHV